jgi:L-asparaginase II
MFNTVPLIEVMRGSHLEAIYRGAIAVVDARGQLVASAGDADLTTFLRSSAKPFQLLPLVESGGAFRLGYSERELAVMAASHNGEEFHVQAVTGILTRLGLDVSALQCGTHPPLYVPAARALENALQQPSPLHNNCSGKHSGMLAQCVDRKLPIVGYPDPQHPIQVTIKRTLAEMTDMSPDSIDVATDGCGVPTFAIPLARSALAFARLADPSGLSEPRRSALQRIASAMMAYPEMVAGTHRLDTDVMRVGKGRVVVKGGAEGYYGIGLLSLGWGVAIKMEDGDGARGRNAVVVETLRQLGALDDEGLAALSRYAAGPTKNHRGLIVGEVRPCFQLTPRGKLGVK